MVPIGSRGRRDIDNHFVVPHLPLSCDTVIVLGLSSSLFLVYLEVAIGVQKQVTWLEITMENVGRVHTLECTQGLVDKVLAMVVTQVLCPDHPVHVCLHEFLDQITKQGRK